MNIELELVKMQLQALKVSPAKESDTEYMKDYKRIFNSALNMAIEDFDMWGEQEGKRIAQFHGEEVSI